MLEKSYNGDMMIQKISNFKNISDKKNKNVLGKEFKMHNNQKLCIFKCEIKILCNKKADRISIFL